MLFDILAPRYRRYCGYFLSVALTRRRRG